MDAEADDAGRAPVDLLVDAGGSGPAPLVEPQAEFIRPIRHAQARLVDESHLREPMRAPSRVEGLEQIDEAVALPGHAVPKPLVPRRPEYPGVAALDLVLGEGEPAVHLPEDVGGGLGKVRRGKPGRLGVVGRELRTPVTGGEGEAEKSRPRSEHREPPRHHAAPTASSDTR